MKKAFLAVAMLVSAAALLLAVSCKDNPDDSGRDGNGGDEPNTPLQYEIKNIFAGSYAMQFVVGEYKIDFENKKFWKYPDSGWTFDRRDAAAENEGFTFVSNLSDEKIKVFFEQASTYGFTSWDDEYVEPMLADGHQWRVIITYANDSTKTISGSNKYPDTYNNMREAFKDLTGETVL